MKKVLLAAVLFLSIISFSPSANGQTGVLDVTFGVGGKVLTGFENSTGGVSAMAVLTNGKIVAAGTLYGGRQIALAQYNTDGSLDSSFGIGGKVLDSVGDGLTYISCISLFIDSTGKIVIGGNAHKYTVSGSFIVRFNSNGSLDSSFGSNGFIHEIIPQTYGSNYTNMLLKSNGKILIVTTGYFNPIYPLIPANTDIVLYQYNNDGSPDVSFGVNGMSRINRPNGNEINSSFGLQSDGKIIVTGSTSWNTVASLFVLRCLPNGILDNSFGVNGIALTDTFYSFKVCGAVIQHDDKIVLNAVIDYDSSSTSPVYLSLFRFTKNGSIDSSYGTLGKGETIFEGSIVNRGYWEGEQVVLQRDGKVLMTNVYLPISPQIDLFAARFDTTGVLDTVFAKKGFIHTDFGGAEFSSVIALQPDGNFILAGQGGTYQFALARYDKNAHLYYNSLLGNVFVDLNWNGVKEANEPYFRNSSVFVSKRTNSYLQTSSTGKFDIDVDTGTYNIQVTNLPPYYNIVPLSHTSSFASYFNADTFSIALHPIPGIKDVSISLVKLVRLRLGLTAKYSVLCANKGTDTANGSFYFIKDSRLVYTGASKLPANISGDTIWWNYSSLAPLDTTGVVIYFNVATAPTLNLGDVVFCSAHILPLPAEISLSDNYTSVGQVIRNSFDPNDKTENHGGRITNTQVANGDYLQYTIRFQNTGNDTAFNVYIHDTLDSKLDWNTLQIITASHNYQMNMSDGKCLFKFPNINLVDSIHNEPGSHGYIVYKVKPKASVQVGDIIKNTAAIYFDYNLPIYTNTEMTKVVAETFPLKLLTFTARKQDKSNLLNWTTANETNVNHFDIERSACGSPDSHRDFSKIGTVKAGANNYSFTDNNPLKATNYYRLRMADKDGQFTYSPIRMINNSGTFSINIYPNPAKDNLQIQIDSDRKTALQLLVLSMDGKVILSNSIDAKEGSILRSINISALVKGSYFLKVLSLNPLLENPPSEGREAQVVKFAKQ